MADGGFLGAGSHSQRSEETVDQDVELVNVPVITHTRTKRETPGLEKCLGIALRRQAQQAPDNVVGVQIDSPKYTFDPLCSTKKTLSYSCINNIKLFSQRHLTYI